MLTTSQRPSSIKTRIKTVLSRSYRTVKEFCQRPSSIKTRIKTQRFYPWAHSFVLVRDHLPLKQGLRRDAVWLYKLLLLVRDHLPLKQGLRQCKDASFLPFRVRVRVHLPLKQGLRQRITFVVHKRTCVRDHLPLKQGLRHKLLLFDVEFFYRMSETIFH